MQSILDTAKTAKVASDVAQVVVENSSLAAKKAPSARYSFIQAAKHIIRKIINFLKTPGNWKKPSTWIGIAIILRVMYSLMNEYGWNPFKKSLKGDHVFLTGAGSGLGRLMAIRLGKLGCQLSLSDINMAGLEETKKILINAGIKEADINIFICDVAKRASIIEAGKIARSRFGEVTMLINNAGIVSGHDLNNLSDAMIERTMQVNTISHLHTIREFLPDMIAKKRGHIVTIASMAGLVAVPGLSDYSASKYGAVAIDESVRQELKKEGLYDYIKTTCICPYFIDTGMFSGAKKAFPFYILQPDEVADRILYAIQ